MKDSMATGRFEILRKIATGGMAEIYLARQESHGGFRRNVAIKRILPKYARNKAWVASFLNEASLAAMLNHPNIVQVYDVTAWNDTYLLTMEYLEGFDLEAVLRTMRTNHRNIPFDVVLTLIGDVLSALDFAHHANDPDGRPLNVVHRDISPSNIFLTAGGQAKVVDFGIAKASQLTNDVEKTRAGTVRGKVSYLSPEQIMTKPLDGRADIFACGVLMYELLTHEHPFRGALDVDTLRNILKAEERPPRERDDVHPGVWDVIHKALAKERDDRYQSCAQMLEAIESLAEQIGLVFSRMHTRRFYTENKELFAGDKEIHEPNSLEVAPMPRSVTTRVVNLDHPDRPPMRRMSVRAAAAVLGAAAAVVAAITVVLTML
jgi:serine/threonine protein kinase